MATPTYDLLASSVLASSASSVTFSSISQDYRDLVLIVTPSATSGGLLVRLNNDSGANYDRVGMSGYSSTAESYTSTASTEANVTRRGTITTSQGEMVAVIQIMDYTATDKHKTILARSNRASNGVDAMALRWANTSAITQVDCVNSGTFSAGSTFYLYGVAA